MTLEELTQGFRDNASGDSGLGASVIEGSIDAHLVLSKSTELKTITATWRKNRGGDLPELFKYKQLEDFDPRGKPRIKLKINLEYPLIK